MTAGKRSNEAVGLLFQWRVAAQAILMRLRGIMSGPRRSSQGGHSRLGARIALATGAICRRECVLRCDFVSMQKVAKELDVRGYNCPIPLLRAKKALASMSPGQILKVMTTDPCAEIDFKVFAEASGNEILALDVIDNVITIVMAKKRA